MGGLVRKQQGLRPGYFYALHCQFVAETIGRGSRIDTVIIDYFKELCMTPEDVKISCLVLE